LKNWSIYLGIVTLHWFLTFSLQYLFIDDFLYYQTFGEQMNLSRIDEILELSKKYEWLGYAIIPMIIILRIFFTASFLYIGIFFTELKAKFGKLFRIALIADAMHVLSALAKLVILIFFKEVQSLEDLQFQPFSVMELLDKSGVDPLFVYPLSLLNFFELSYFFILAWLLVPLINIANTERPVKFSKSLQLVTASYGSGLLLWVLVVMFITLNMS
jgi:hypothetical protein